MPATRKRGKSPGSASRGAGVFFWAARKTEPTPRFPALPHLCIEATFAAPANLQVIAMASRITERLRNEVLNLPDTERAELARELVQSLDGPADADAAKEWEAEILRRLDAVDSGRAQIIDRAEFARRMRERITRL